MSLVQDTLFGHEDKVQTAIDRLKAFEPPEGYYVAFSGGKDSQCVYHLCKMAGVKFDAHYSVTSVDPPELMQFVKSNYPDVQWEYHYWNDGKPEHYYPSGKPRNITMWNLIADHTIPPTRQARYCCSALKETGGAGRLVVTGVRWAESTRRKALHGVADIQTESKKLHAEAQDNPSYRMNKNGGIVFMDDNSDTRRMVEHCYAKRKTTINPIVDWEDEDVWEFLNDVAKVQHCCLYDEGFARLGCIGCPLQGRESMLREFERWPRYKELYIQAFDQMIKNHPGEIRVATGEPAETGGGGTSCENGSDGAYKYDWSEGGGQQSSNGSSISDGRDDAYMVDVDAPEHEILGGTEPDTTLEGGATPTRFPDGNGGGRQRNGISTGGSAISDGDAISGLLAVAMPQQSDGFECTSLARIRPERTKLRKNFNPDPRVADYESGEKLLEEWIENWN